LTLYALRASDYFAIKPAMPFHLPYIETPTVSTSFVRQELLVPPEITIVGKSIHSSLDKPDCFGLYYNCILIALTDYQTVSMLVEIETRHNETTDIAEEIS